MSASDNRLALYVGTYTWGDDEGIYLFHMDSQSGDIDFVEKATEVDKSAFLAVSPDERFLYCVSEIKDRGGEPAGGAAAFAIDRRTGRLSYLNEVSSGGPGPCHLATDGTGRWVLVANYVGGSVALLPVADDGRLGAPAHVVQHVGSSVNPKRQAEPHAHSVTMSPNDRFVFVADLGLDKMTIYKLDRDKGRLEPAPEPFARVAPGAGPRHFIFGRDGRCAYVMNEIDSTIAAFSYDEASGRLTRLETVSALPADFEGTSHTAEICVSSSSRFLYGSNRGHDSIVVFEIDETTGGLTYVCHQPTLGKTPRNFDFSPDGSLLVAANRDSDNLVVFRVDPATGRLTETGHTAEVPAPGCVKMIPIG